LKPRMAYLVKITARAERDLASLYDEINAGHSGAALAWYLGLKKCIFSLENRPKRCRVFRRRNGLRNLLYGHKPHIYRIIFRVLQKQKQVEILHIRHGARREQVLGASQP
jgi:toxin ParE1/3/4